MSNTIFFMTALLFMSIAYPDTQMNNAQIFFVLTCIAVAVVSDLFRAIKFFLTN